MMNLSGTAVEQLIEKWDKKGFKLSELSDDILKRNTAILLENEHQYILSEGGNLTADVPADFKKILMPLTRRIFPNLLANEIVGVQPMAGPVSLAFALRFKANGTYASGAITSYDSSGNPVYGELGYNTIDNAWTGTGTSPNGTGALTASAEQWSNDQGVSAATSPNMVDGKLVVESVTVTAATRKMRARYSLEAAQDLKNLHGLDIESELTNMLQYEIAAEIDRQLVTRINGLAAGVDGMGNAKTYTYVVSAGDTRGEAEKFRTLYTRIVRESAAIAKRTRRGAGNFIIASGNVVTALDSLGTFLMQPLAGANPMDLNANVAKVGSIENRFTVYRDTFATSDYVTVGFKGQGVQNAGVIYCPYIPIMVSKAVEPGNFTPVVGLMTRYGLVDHLMSSKDFYNMITVNFAGITGMTDVI